MLIATLLVSAVAPAMALASIAPRQWPDITKGFVCNVGQEPQCCDINTNVYLLGTPIQQMYIGKDCVDALANDNKTKGAVGFASCRSFPSRSPGCCSSVSHRL